MPPECLKLHRINYSQLSNFLGGEGGGGGGELQQAFFDLLLSIDPRWFIWSQWTQTLFPTQLLRKMELMVCCFCHCPLDNDDQTLWLQAGAGEDNIIHLPSGRDRVDCKRQEEEEEVIVHVWSCCQVLCCNEYKKCYNCFLSPFKSGLPVARTTRATTALR